MKFGRKFRLLFEFDTTTEEKSAIEIATPFTLEFDIVRNTSSSLNSATFRVYNLNETNRSLIFQNRTSINDASGKRKRVLLQAGYNSLDNTINKDGDLTTIFRGDLLEAYSFRQGPDVITYINAQDGGFGAYNSTISTTLNAGASFKEVIEQVGSTIKGVEIGSIGETPGFFKTPTPLHGNSFYLLTEDYEGEVFIDLEKLNKLNRNEYIKSLGVGVPLINSDTGLLGTPLRQGTDLIVDMLFEPKINVGQLIEIKSQFNKKFDGQYKVNGVRHSGVISDAVGGECRTSLQLYIGDKLLGELKEV